MSIPIIKFLFDRDINAYKRELSIKETTIQSLRVELENSKQYQIDTLVRSLAERVKIGNEEIERLRADATASKSELAEKEKQQNLLYAEITDLRERLRSYEEELDDLVEDYCEICDPDEDHIWANYIDWGTALCEISGDENLVSRVGYCNYCTSPQIKCGICGSVNSINLESDRQVECVGGCGVIFTIDSFVEDKSLQYSINVSRAEDETDE